MKKLTKQNEWFSPLSKISDQRTGYLISKDWLKLMQAFVYNAFGKCKTIWFGTYIGPVNVTTSTTFVSVTSTNIGTANLGHNNIFDITSGNIALVNFQKGWCTVELNAEFYEGNENSYRYVVVAIERGGNAFLTKEFRCDVQTRKVGNLACFTNFICQPNDVIKIGVREGGTGGIDAKATINLRVNVDLDALPIVEN